MAGHDTTIHTWRAGGVRYLVCPALPEVAAEIHRLVPPDRVEYDPLRRVWRLRGVFWLALQRALCDDLHLGPVREYASREAYERAHPDRPTSSALVAHQEAYETLFVSPAAPTVVVAAAYKALARLYHPDHGGDPARMAAINAAWERINRDASTAEPRAS